MSINHNHIPSPPLPHPPEIRGLLRYYRISEDAVAARAGCHRSTVRKFFTPALAIRMVTLSRHQVQSAITELLRDHGCTEDLGASWAALDSEMTAALEAAA